MCVTAGERSTASDVVTWRDGDNADDGCAGDHRLTGANSVTDPSSFSLLVSLEKSLWSPPFLARRTTSSTLTSRRERLLSSCV